MAKVKGGRRISSEADACACLADLERSGLTLNGWCRAHNVGYDSLRTWRRRLAAANPATLVELVPAAPVNTGPTRPAHYTLLVGAVQLVVQDDFADATLARIIRVVAAC